MISAASSAGYGVAIAPLATAESSLELDTIHHHYEHDGDGAVAAKVAAKQGTSGPARAAWFRAISPELRKSLGDTTSISLSWKDLAVRVVPEKKRLAAVLQAVRRKSNTKVASPVGEPRKILNGVSGVVQSGECMALMGASGAGKTTLINMLTGRKREMKLQMEGTICVNGQQIGSAITMISGYVQQMDLALPTLTVREHLNFHANLRMDRAISPKERKERVEEVILDLGLTKCADALIGSAHIKGISGGEMKRLQFGCEVLTDPPLLFCDEPTSGLDSFMAEAVVSIMKKLAARGKTVVCTIHQPSSSVFAMFDKFMLLAEGRVAFLGPRVEAIPFFNSIGIQVPEDHNPADFFIHSLAIMPGHEDECRVKANEICDQFAVSDLGVSMKKQVNESTPDVPANDRRVAGSSRYMKHHGQVTYKASYWEQMQAVLWRSVTTMRREPMLLRVRLGQVVVIGLIFGLIFLQQTNNMAGVQNINGLMYMFLMQMTMGNMFAVIMTFTNELPVFLKEHDSAMYRTDVYYLAKTLVDIPVFIILPFILVTISYWMAAMNPDFGIFVICCCILAVVANVAVSFAYIFSCACSSTQTAVGLGMTMVMPLTLFGGLFISLKSAPSWLYWIQYVSWFRYANEALLINQWESVDVITCTNATEAINGTCAGLLPNGQAVLDRLNFKRTNYILDIGILFLMILIFRVIAYLALWNRTRK